MRSVVAGSDVYAYTGSRPLDAALPTVVFVHGAAQRPQRLGAAVALFRAPRLQRARRRPARARPLGGRGAGVGRGARRLARATSLDAAGVARAALVGHSLGSLAALECAARHPGARVASSRCSAPPRRCRSADDAARRREGATITSPTSSSPAGRTAAGKQLGGNQVPGMWMTGNALRLLERTQPGVLHADLVACNRVRAAGSPAAAKVRCPALAILGARDLMAPPKNAQRADRRAAATAQVVTLSGLRPRADGRAARRGARRAARLPLRVTRRHLIEQPTDGC